MILVTVGTSTFPFARMNALVGRLSEHRKRHEPIVFQYGVLVPQYYYPPIELFPFMPQEGLLAFMKKARVVICHGGPATIYQSLSFGNIPWVLPRQQKFGEHLTDHQVEFSVFMQRRRLIRIVSDDTPLGTITRGSTKTPPLRHQNTKLISFLDSIVQTL
jgi:UDP-N-acetylglucosamine transferase subunit ALG13